MPKAGGDYVYLSRGLSPMFGFLFGWTRSMIMSPGMAAVVAAGVLRFVEFLFPAVAIPLFTWHVTLFSQSQPFQFTLTAGQPLRQRWSSCSPSAIISESEWRDASK